MLTLLPELVIESSDQHVFCEGTRVMERHLMQADPARGNWGYRITHDGQTFIQVVYLTANDRVSTYVVRTALEEHQSLAT